MCCDLLDKPLLPWRNLFHIPEWPALRKHQSYLQFGIWIHVWILGVAKYSMDDFLCMYLISNKDYMKCIYYSGWCTLRIIHNGLNSLRPRQNRRHFADDVFKCNFLNENVWIPIKTSLKFVPQGPINTISALVQIMAWRRSGDKPLSEPMMISLPTHICVTRPQWVKTISPIWPLWYKRMLGVVWY